MRFNRLNRVEGSAYNSSAREFARGCLEDTRVGILEKIHSWIRTGSTLLFWLNGVAGTGKSTIAHTIAQHYDSEGSRGASFFFSRDQQARRETRFLFQTIAFQLGNAYPALKLEIVGVLEDRSILTSTLRHQFRRLILDPVSKTVHSFSSSAVIVLDALDECEDEGAVLHIIELLVSELADRCLPLKFLVTSRPETNVCSIFRSRQVASRTYPFVLHDIKASDVLHDITRFIKHELGQIADRCSQVLRHELWPKEHEIGDLVRISMPLFIAAATAVKFITPVRGSRDPRIRLRMILDSTRSGSAAESRPFRYLDHMYTQILEHATGGEQPSDVFEQFQTVVGMIVLAYGQLTIGELAGLLQMEDNKVELLLVEFQFGILIPQGGGLVRAFHLSFHDYLTDKTRCINENFFIDPSVRHAEIARLCLERMICLLKRDICNIGDHTKMNHEVSDLDQKKATFLPGDLQYACRYWALHLRESATTEVLIQLVEHFISTSILYWIEALSLIGELGGGMTSLQETRIKLSVSLIIVIMRDNIERTL